MGADVKASIVVFPFRSAAASEQPKLPAARAWRLIARVSAEFAPTAPAVVAGVAPAAPAGCLDGCYPAWVQLTHANGSKMGDPLMVDGNGWNAQPTGRDWQIVVVHGLGDGDRFAFVVEYIDADDSLDLCGQVNTPPASVTA